MHRGHQEVIRRYIKSNIFPLYERVDEGHRLPHIKAVIERSLMFADEWNEKNPDNQVDKFKCEIIASYHDVGLAYADRKLHEKKSAEILRSDNFLKQYFSDNEMTTMADAVEDHRASMQGVPRSPYGMIVSQADRDTSLDYLLYRTFAYRQNKPQYRNDFKLLYDDIYQHLSEKYSDDGYAMNKIWFKDKALDDFRSDVRHTLRDETLLTNRILRVVEQNDLTLAIRYRRSVTLNVQDNNKDVIKEKE